MDLLNYRIKTCKEAYCLLPDYVELVLEVTHEKPDTIREFCFAICRENKKKRMDVDRFKASNDTDIVWKRILGILHTGICSQAQPMVENTRSFVVVDSLLMAMCKNGIVKECQFHFKESIAVAARAGLVGKETFQSNLVDILHSIKYLICQEKELREYIIQVEDIVEDLARWHEKLTGICISEQKGISGKQADMIDAFIISRCGKYAVSNEKYACLPDSCRSFSSVFFRIKSEKDYENLSFWSDLERIALYKENWKKALVTLAYEAFRACYKNSPDTAMAILQNDEQLIWPFTDKFFYHIEDRFILPEVPDNAVDQILHQISAFLNCIMNEVET